MDKFVKRLVKREEGIRNWLIQNTLESTLKKADQILDNLPREDIKKAFKVEIARALEHCAKNDEIKALDFEWYYDGGETGGALAYGLDGCETKGRLSKTDLGPDELPGIELRLKHGALVDEYFAEIPVNVAINEMVKNIIPEIEKSRELGSITNEIANEAEVVINDYFQIWNYKLGSEACEQLRESNIELKLKDKSPFWVTMTRHGRWSVSIMLID